MSDHATIAEEALSHAMATDGDVLVYHAAAAQTHALLAIAAVGERLITLLTEPEPVVEAEVHCQGCTCASEEQLPTAMDLADQIAAAMSAKARADQ